MRHLEAELIEARGDARALYLSLQRVYFAYDHLGPDGLQLVMASVYHLLLRLKSDYLMEYNLGVVEATRDSDDDRAN